MILDDILTYRREQLKREKSIIPPEEMRAAALASSRVPLDFKKAITKSSVSIISEVKKASPSKGVIAKEFAPLQAAINYEKSGAAAISVLTEEHYFMGSSQYLRDIRAAVNIPILRKDFIFDPYQIYEAKLIGADAVLLIAALLSAEEMRELRLLSESLGMSVLCESHNAEEIRTCIAAGASIFGINNRDLKTFEVSLDKTGELIGLLPEDAVKVSESGMFTAEDILFVHKSGANAVLVGESLMRDPTLLGRLKEETR